jgi:sulfur-oxidizing protein SoxB
VNRREFIQLLMQGAAVAGVGAYSGSLRASSEALYDLEPFGSARILHMTDSHAQLLPIYFREPNVNIGLGEAYGRSPHLVGRNLLKQLGEVDPRQAHALTYLDFTAAAEKFGRVGGFAHLKTLIDRLRGAVPDGASLLLDGGDTWQGSGTALWTRGMDMVEATNLLGVDIMTGHWEFTYLEDEVHSKLEAFNGEFVAQNLRATEEAMFEGVPVYDDFTGHVFKPYTMRELQGRRVAVIGQAFPYTPIANPKRFIPNWTFGIREDDLAELVAEIRANEEPDAVILLSHNGMDVDLKLAGRVPGIDFILGGHTHDGMPRPLEIENSGGRTLVTNAGSNGKFLGVLDLQFGASGLSGYRYRLLPVFSELLAADPRMQAHIDAVRAPHREVLEEELAIADSLLYRRGNFNGSFDQLIVDGLRAELDAQISPVAGLPLGDHGDARRGDHHGPPPRPDLHDLPRDLRARDDRRGTAQRARECRRQPVQRRPLLPAGRRHGAHRRLPLQAGPHGGHGQPRVRDDPGQWQGDGRQGELQGRGLGHGRRAVAG